MVACSIPARMGSAEAAAWAASRMLVQTGSTERRSDGLAALSMALSSLPFGAVFQLLDQRLDFASVVLNVGREAGSSSDDHADALDFDVGDARAGAAIAHLPLDLGRLAVGLVEPAVDHRDPVGAGGNLAEREGLAAILAEPLGVGVGLGADGSLEIARLQLG